MYMYTPPASKFDRFQALAHMTRILGPIPKASANRGPLEVRLAFKYVPGGINFTPPLATEHLPWVARYPEDEPRYFWLERAFPAVDPYKKTLDFVERLTAATRTMIGGSLKTMISPSLYREGGKRTVDNIYSTRVIHLDYDAQHMTGAGERLGPLPGELKRELIKQFRPLIVQSGNPNSFHAYIMLGYNAMRAERGGVEAYRYLSAVLRKRFNCDAKGSPNDLLGLAGTPNIKPGLGSPLVKLWQPRLATMTWPSAEALAGAMLLEWPPVATEDDGKFQSKTQRLSDKPIPSPTQKMLRRRIRNYLEKEGFSDTSAASYFATCLCIEVGLDCDQAIEYLGQYPRLKFIGDALARDVKSIYSKKGVA